MGSRKIQIVLIAVALAAITFNSFGQPVTPADIHAAISRGLSWLRAHQNPNGSWGYGSLDPRPGWPPHDNVVPGDVALTALCALAFLNHGVPETDPAVSRAIKYLLMNVRSDGSITNGDYPTYQTAIAILPLIATGNPAYSAVIQNARDFLRNIQNTSIPQTDPAYGGWGYGWETGAGEDEGGGGGGELIVRDNPHDWGIVPSNPPFWVSPDIWVDNNGDGVPDRIVPGRVNRLFAAVHNIGAVQLNNVTVEFWCDELTAGFDFNSASPIGTATIPSIPPFSTGIAEVKWNVPPIPEGGPFMCVAVRAYCSADPLTNPNSVPYDNNIALRSFVPIKGRPDEKVELSFTVHNNLSTAANIELGYQFVVTPPSTWTVAFDQPGPFSLNAGDEAPNIFTVYIPPTASPGEVGVIDVIEKDQASGDVIGGFRVAILVLPKAVKVANIAAQSGREYQIEELEIGIPCYTDRDDVVIESIPSPLVGGLLLRTPDADARSVGDGFLSFDIDVPATVYVLLDSRGDPEKGGAPPAWLTDNFTKAEGWRVRCSDPSIGYYTVWKREFGAGTVQLGGNADQPASGAESNYLVVILPSGTAQPAGAPAISSELAQIAEEPVDWDVWNPGPIYKLPGTGYSPGGGGNWADLSNTQWAVMALEHFPPPGTPWRDAALVFVERCQRDDPTDRPGGFIYSPVPGAPRSSRPFGSMTYAGIWCYRLLGLPISDPRVRGALRWVAHHYSVSENPPYGDWAYYYYCLTMARALKLCGMRYIVTPDGVHHDWYLELAAELISRQLPDGSWVNSAAPELGEWSRALCTAYALLTLETGLLPPGHPITVVFRLTTSPLELHIYDEMGRHTGPTPEGGFETGIPGSTYEVGDGEVIVRIPASDAGKFTAVVRSADGSTQSFTLTVEGYRDGEAVYTREFQGEVAQGQPKRFDLFLTSIVGGPTFFCEEAEPIDISISVDPTSLQLTGVQGGEATGQLTIRETGGNDTTLRVRVTELEDGRGNELPIRLIELDQGEVNLPAGGEAVVNVTIHIPPDLPEGDYSGDVIIADSSGFVINRVPVDLKIEPAELDGVISGVVVDKDGNPIEGATVSISGMEPWGYLVSRSTTTSQDGSFELKAVEGNTYWLKARKEGYMPRVMRVTASATDLRVVMMRMPELIVSKLRMWAVGDAHLNDLPVQPGDVVAVADADGVICGLFVVEEEGRYGPMAIYGDDPETEQDEGAREGEELLFMINGELVGTIGPDEPVWRLGKLANIDLGRRVRKFLLGDVSGNGRVTAFDASMVLRHVVEKIRIPDDRLWLADVTGNGEVSPTDAAWMLRYVVGLIGSFDEIERGNPAPPVGIDVRLGDAAADVSGMAIVPLEIKASGLMGGLVRLRYDPAMLKPMAVSGAGAEVEWNDLGGELVVAFASARELGEVRLNLSFRAARGVRGTEIALAELWLNESKLNLNLRGEVKVIPERTALLQNYPNPFNPETWIPFVLAEDADVEIRIYDLSGRLIRRLELGRLRAGYYLSRGSAAYWDGRNEQGERVSSGVYVYQLIAGRKVISRKMVVLK
ncbi:hypothetical protein DRP77_04825 [Candidatus Poribacteria bacterium]|nr:MAG: hypothetical protein DRP77_04825 [Candidatus Poribacteria bacterium]